MRRFADSKASRQAIGEVDLAPRDSMKHRPSIRQRMRPALWGTSNHMHGSLKSHSGSVVRDMVTSRVNFKDKALFSQFPPQQFAGGSKRRGARYPHGLPRFSAEDAAQGQ